jgi:hypothetical protein
MRYKHVLGRLCPEKGVWNFQALKTPAFIGAGEFRTLFLGKACSATEMPILRTGAKLANTAT